MRTVYVHRGSGAATHYPGSRLRVYTPWCVDCQLIVFAKRGDRTKISAQLRIDGKRRAPEESAPYL